ncbi:ABC-type branched-chain amino acid transport system, ATPase component [Acidovorax sp. CF316]|uniref:ABC transporter ATP-binding protein n=1 Tax=Acidovorax sp. CF316 TaxID=1144317 RepID=UPI00026BE1CF|nr:ABC transporter ATP-binding protein [Acidovorax sp. CF316]EJE52869.1 ABC-type branched-chain amino acid transport system, ATPase component [Acidovorax sp. CF316]
MSAATQGSTLRVDGLVKRFGGLLVTDHFRLEVRPGELHAIIGPNGAGKTTLINQLSGELAPHAGSIQLDGQELVGTSVQRRARMGIARSYQITSVFHEFTALQNVMLAVQGASGHNFAFWKPVLQDTDLVDPAQALLLQVGLGGQAGTRVSAMAHGARRQLELAMTLALRPRVMLLDEPMAGMSQKESEDMVRLLHTLKGRYGIVLVEHDMDAVFALADRITVMVYGKPIACGTADEIKNDPEVRRAYLGDQVEAV